MHNVFEVFKDGKRFLLFSNEDYFTCEVWVRNHSFCTNALQRGFSKLVIEQEAEMKNISIYDIDAENIEKFADENGITVAELVEAMVQCFAENGGSDYL